jgi:hypothetical protein
VVFVLNVIKQTSENSVKAKFSKVSSRQPRSASEEARTAGGPAKRGKEEREDRPNAVTLITLRLPGEHRLCQVAIISIPGGHFSIAA